MGDSVQGLPHALHAADWGGILAGLISGFVTFNHILFVMFSAAGVPIGTIRALAEVGALKS